MLARLRQKSPFVLANLLTMIVLHGNSKQFWPKIPYLSLRDESVGEHSRLLFNTLAVVTLGQLLSGRLPRALLLPRAISLVALPAALPPLLALGHRLRLRGAAEGFFHLTIVLGLPLGVAMGEEYAATLGQPSQRTTPRG